MSGKKRVAVLISGRGSNMEALIAATQAADFPAEIVGVISNKPDAAGLTTAAAAGIATAVISLKDYPSKDEADAALTARLEAWGTEIVCLAGFMRLLSGAFCRHWQGRMINIHPSLLPAFNGLDTHARAIAEGAKVHGCTVHFVTEGMDEGPVILQTTVPVEPDDTPETLAARVLKAEHATYPAALRLVAEGRARF